MPVTQAPEYEHVEYKQSLASSRDIAETVAAFATARGGTIRIGIAPDGRRIGVQLGRVTLENIANNIRDSTDPPQYPSITVEGDEDAAVINIRVEESALKPVWAHGVPFKRVGRSNQRLSPEETKRLMEITAGRTWDALPCPELRMEDIDRKTVELFLRRSGQSVRTTTKGVLENLGLLTRDGLCNGAALLFAKNPQRIVPEAQVKCARFRGTTSVEFIDEQTITGNLLTQPDMALAFVLRNIQQSIRITGRAERETISEYPEAAVREAVINAICHRDYTRTGTVQIRIYDDRLEIWNPGMLPPDLTVEALYREHPSRPRYPRIASALHHADMIEHWGTGTLRIVEVCRERGLPRPRFSSEIGVFMVRFEKAPNIAPQIVQRPFSQRQLETLAYVQKYGKITTAVYGQLFGLSDTQSRKDLGWFVREGLFVRVGAGRSVHYILASSFQGEEDAKMVQGTLPGSGSLRTI
jgi:ATP-dependent DNA helicase RecG